MTVYRPEKQTDPAKLPGQIINRPSEQTYIELGVLYHQKIPGAVFLRDYIAMVEDEESRCRCTKPSEPCEGCPLA